MIIKQAPFSLGRLILKAAMREKQNVNVFKKFSIEVDNFYVSASVLQDFEKQFMAADKMPTFIFNACFPLVMQCIAQSNIPSSLLGLIHISSHFKVNEMHNWRLPCRVVVEFNSARKLDKGILYRIKTSLYQNDRNTLVNTNTFLDKHKSYHNNSTRQPDGDRQTLNDVRESVIASYKFDQQAVWQYAKASKDFNPIHLNHNLAKLFGLKRALVHGMLNAHSAVADIVGKNDDLLESVQVDFNKPCFIPCSVNLSKLDADLYVMTSARGTQRHLTIKVSKATEEEQVE